MTRLRAACIGISGYASHYFNAFIDEAKANRMELVAICDLKISDGDRTALQEAGLSEVKEYSNYLEMLEKEQIDLVSIGTGLHLHYPMVQAALAADCHIILAKPATVTVQAIDDMIGMEKESGKKVIVDFQHSYSDGTRAVKQAIADGVIGDVVRITNIYMWPRGDNYYARNDWAGNLMNNGEYVLDGPINNPHAHYIFNALFFAQPELGQVAFPESVEAELYHARPTISGEDMASIRAKTDTGVEICHYSVLSYTGPMVSETLVEGTKGTCTWSPTTYSITPVGEEKQIIDFARGSTANLVKRTLDYFNGEGEIHSTLENCRAHVLFTNGSYESSGRVNRISDQYVQKTVDKDTFYAVEDIDTITRQAAESGALFSETGAPWASKSTSFRLEGYSQALSDNFQHDQ